jgi:hypothetical protein
MAYLPGVREGGVARRRKLKKAQSSAASAG